MTNETLNRFLPRFLAGLFVLAVTINSSLPVFAQKAPADSPAPESPSLILVPNGMAVITSSGTDGSTVRVMDITQFGGLWANPANLAPNYISASAQMPTVQIWTPAQFVNSGGSQVMRTLAIKADGTSIYAGASGYTGVNLTPSIYRIGPSAATPVLLATLPSYVANVAIRRGIGGLDLDEAHNAVFASNLADGIIYRRDAATGASLGSFDPLTPYSIGSTNLPPYGERVIAVAYNKAENRLYYGIWGYDVVAATGINSVRSVGLDAAGAFLPATDQLEFTLPGSVAPIADIEFNTAGNKMLLAEENMFESGGVINLGAHNARSLEYQGGVGAWAIDPTLYDVGTLKYNVGGFSNRKNSRGGIAWAYTNINIFDGTITGNENFVMFTGDALRLDGIASVYGLQYTPAAGGGAAGGVASNSLIADLDYDVSMQDKFVYGDVDIRRSLDTTAAEVSVSGMVMNSSGAGISGASVKITGMDGSSRAVIANAFGYYRFDNVAVNETYVLEASAKRSRFDPQIVNVNGEMTGVNFIAN
jgi:hypothetical protein